MKLNLMPNFRRHSQSVESLDTESDIKIHRRRIAWSAVTSFRRHSTSTENLETNSEIGVEKNAWPRIRRQLIKKVEPQAKELLRNEVKRRLESILERWQDVDTDDKRWLTANLMVTDEDIYLRIWRGVIDVDMRGRAREEIRKQEEERRAREEQEELEHLEREIGFLRA